MSGNIRTEALTFYVATVANGDINTLNLPYAFDVVSITTKSASGTCTLTGKIDTVALGGTANSVSSSEQTQLHTTANEVAVGNDFTLTASANAACLGMSVTVKIERQD